MTDTTKMSLEGGEGGGIAGNRCDEEKQHKLKLRRE